MLTKILARLRQYVLPVKTPYEVIDPQIKPLVDRMNATEVIQTVASCQGHDYIFWGYSDPYVYFKAPVNLVGLIEQQLREEYLRIPQRLTAAWAIQGIFDNNCEITFLLFSPKYRHGFKQSTFESIFSLGLNRKQLDYELLYLAGLIEKTVLLYFRNKNEPCISQYNYCEDSHKQPK